MATVTYKCCICKESLEADTGYDIGLLNITSRELLRSILWIHNGYFCERCKDRVLEFMGRMKADYEKELKNVT